MTPTAHTDEGGSQNRQSQADAFDFRDTRSKFRCHLCVIMSYNSSISRFPAASFLSSTHVIDIWGFAASNPVLPLFSVPG